MSMSQKPKHISWPHQHVVGPMVNASDIPFRLLCRKYGADVCYTQMWKSWLMDAKNPDACAYTARVMAEFEAGAADRPLIIQFAGRDVPSLLHAARTVQDHVDAVDINLGCPQKDAMNEGYGSFLLDARHDARVMDMVRTLARELRVPVTCKIRLLRSETTGVTDLARTIAYAQQLEAAGCSLLAVHGRFRGGVRYRRRGAADLSAIAAIKAAVGIPVLCNGNTSTLMCVRENLATTGCEGVMSCEGILHNPLIFSLSKKLVSMGGMRCAVDRFYVHLKTALERHAAAAAEDAEEKGEKEEKEGVDVLYVALEYVDACLEMKETKTATTTSGGQGVVEGVTSDTAPTLFHPALPSARVVWFHVKKMCRPELIRYQTLDEIEEYIKTATVQDVHAAVLKTILRRDSGYAFDRGLHRQTKKRRKIQDSNKLLKRGRPETW